MSINTSAQIKASLAPVRELLSEDFKKLDQLICDQLESKIPLIRTITHHIITSGGKRLRPLLLLLSAKSLGYEGDEHIELAATIEFIHTATLMHDDVVDNSSMRRGKKTAHEIWGNQASVLVGDFLYSRAFQILARRSNIPAMKLLSQTTNTIAEGEVMQLVNIGNIAISPDTYFDIIYHKTGALFSAATQIGALLNEESDKTGIQEALANYGKYLGLSFQIVDDILDYQGNEEKIGKNLGDDLAEGKLTLPLIYALKKASPDESHQLRTIIEEASDRNLKIVQDILNNTKAIEHCWQDAKKFVSLAKDSIKNLPENRYQQSLMMLAEFALNRDQ